MPSRERNSSNNRSDKTFSNTRSVLGVCKSGYMLTVGHDIMATVSGTMREGMIEVESVEVN